MCFCLENWQAGYTAAGKEFNTLKTNLFDTKWEIPSKVTEAPNTVTADLQQSSTKCQHAQSKTSQRAAFPWSCCFSHFYHALPCCLLTSSGFFAAESTAHPRTLKIQHHNTIFINLEYIPRCCCMSSNKQASRELAPSSGMCLTWRPCMALSQAYTLHCGIQANECHMLLNDFIILKMRNNSN